MKTATRKNTKQGIPLHGVHTFLSYDISNQQARELENELLAIEKLPNEERVKKEVKDHYKSIIGALRAYLRERQVIVNTIMLPFREKLAQRMAQDGLLSELADLFITHAGLGTSDANSESDSLDKLENEVFRKGFGFREADGDTAIAEFYFSTTDTDGTYEEYGLFIDSDDNIDSPTILSRLITGTWIKSDLEGLRVRSEITISSS